MGGGVLPGGGRGKGQGVYGEFGGGGGRGAEAPFTVKMSPLFGENAFTPGDATAAKAGEKENVIADALGPSAPVADGSKPHCSQKEEAILSSEVQESSSLQRVTNPINSVHTRCIVKTSGFTRVFV